MSFTYAFGLTNHIKSLMFRTLLRPNSKLRDEHRSVLLPLLVILAITVTLVILLLTHWYTRNLSTMLVLIEAIGAVPH